MVETKDIALILTTLGLIALGGMEITGEKGYYCEDTNLVLNCESFTASGQCRYIDSNGDIRRKICDTGWKPVTDLIVDPPVVVEVTDVKVNANGKLWNCEMTDGFIDTYTICETPDGRIGYAGEFI